MTKKSKWIHLNKVIRENDNGSIVVSQTRSWIDSEFAKIGNSKWIRETVSEFKQFREIESELKVNWKWIESEFAIKIVNLKWIRRAKSEFKRIRENNCELEVNSRKR